MRLRILGAAALASAALAACNQQPAPAPQPAPPPQSTDGGYGPFGANAPQGPQQPQPAPMYGPAQGAAQGGESVLAGGGLNAPPEFQRLMLTILDGYSKQMAEGWIAAGDVITSLNVGGEHVVDVSLRGGRSYAFIGACDNECNDVDLVLEQANGGQIAQDVLPDDYPLVEVTPPADGVYRLRIRLKTCTIAPCYVAARLVYQP